MSTQNDQERQKLNDELLLVALGITMADEEGRAPGINLMKLFVQTHGADIHHQRDGHTAATILAQGGYYKSLLALAEMDPTVLDYTVSEEDSAPNLKMGDTPLLLLAKASRHRWRDDQSSNTIRITNKVEAAYAAQGVVEVANAYPETLHQKTRQGTTAALFLVDANWFKEAWKIAKLHPEVLRHQAMFGDSVALLLSASPGGHKYLPSLVAKEPSVLKHETDFERQTIGMMLAQWENYKVLGEVADMDDELFTRRNKKGDTVLSYTRIYFGWRRARRVAKLMRKKGIDKATINACKQRVRPKQS